MSFNLRQKQSRTKTSSNSRRNSQLCTSSMCFRSKLHGKTGRTTASESMAPSSAGVTASEFPEKLGKGKVGREGRDNKRAPWATVGAAVSDGRCDDIRARISVVATDVARGCSEGHRHNREVTCVYTAVYLMKRSTKNVPNTPSYFTDLTF